MTRGKARGAEPPKTYIHRRYYDERTEQLRTLCCGVKSVATFIDNDGNPDTAAQKLHRLNDGFTPSPTAEQLLGRNSARGRVSDRARARELASVARTLLHEASRATEDDYETVRENFATAVDATTDALDAVQTAVDADLRAWAIDHNEYGKEPA